jgi:hypothetical protein
MARGESVMSIPENVRQKLSDPIRLRPPDSDITAALAELGESTSSQFEPRRV